MQPTTRPTRLTAAPERATALGLVSLLSTFAIVVGVTHPDDLDLTPREGTGYELGIVGLVCMLALLLYSLRKRMPRARSLGPVRHWFHVHMILGVVGPTAILFHARFGAESTNGAVALVAMLLVAGSGIIGRFVYTRVHVGLFGNKETLQEIVAREASSRRAIHDALRDVPEAIARLEAFESEALGSVAEGRTRLPTLGLRTWWTKHTVARALRSANTDRALVVAARRHLDLVRRVSGFAFWERLLSLWHVLHVPLCAVLVVAAALHVLAVHRY